jgi:hypothetical protein
MAATPPTHVEQMVSLAWQKSYGGDAPSGEIIERVARGKRKL